jgi:GSH-dependent disulfide-bond oxidoreductase
VTVARPIELHFWPTPNGYKVNIALRELGLPYVIKPVDIGRGEQFSPAFQKLSPNGRMPAILDPDGPDGEPISVFESGAILQYLARKTGNRFYGDDERARVEVDQWLFWQMSGLGPMAGQANHFRSYAPAMTADQRHLAYGVNRYTNELDRLYGVMESRLRDRDYLAGDYSIADMACWPWSRYPGARGVDLADFPKVSAWVDRIGARAAVQGAYEEGEAVRKGASTLADAGKDAEEQRKILFGQRARR